jgi:hypothetical protein
MLGQLDLYRNVLVVGSAFSFPSHQKPFGSIRVPFVYAARMPFVHLAVL